MDIEYPGNVRFFSKKKIINGISLFSDRTGNKEVILMKVDISDLESVYNFCKEFNEKEDRLDILINNAGM